MLWVVLSCCGSCLFCHVVAHLYFLGTKQEWNLPNITAVSDNAANEKKAFELLNWTRFLFVFVLLLYVPSQQLWSLRDGQFT